MLVGQKLFFESLNDSFQKHLKNESHANCKICKLFEEVIDTNQLILTDYQNQYFDLRKGKNG